MAFSFGASSSQPSSGFGSAGNTGSTFGATTNSSAGTLFGAGANTNASSAGTLFGTGTSNNTTGTAFGNNASNTAAGTLFGANTGNSFGATSQPGSSFGFGNTSTATSTAPTTAFGAQQSTTPGFVFGQQQQQQNTGFGFGQQQQQQNTGFGATSAPGTTGFGFGANNNTTTTSGFGGFGAGNTTATSTAGAFGGFGAGNATGTSTAGGFSGFGATSTANTGSLFKPAAPTLGSGSFQTTLPFGTSNQQQGTTQFGGFGSAGNTAFGGFGQQQQQQQQQPSRNVWQELALIRAHWDPASRLCQFRHYFYNVVQPNERHLYIRPPDQDEELWNEAMRKNPDPNNLVPVLAVGYGDVLKRMDIQDQAVEVHRNKLAEIGERLQTIQQKHALVTLVKIGEQRRRNIDLTQRLIRMLRCVQVLRYKGFPLEHDEEKLMQNLKLIAEQPSNPEQLNVKLRESWIALQQIKRKRQEAPEDSWRATSKEDLETIAQLLAQEQDGLSHIHSTLSKDMEEIQNIEESLRSNIKRASRGRSAMMTGS